MITRREALQRTVALLGLGLSPATITAALAQADASRSSGTGARHLTPARFALAAAMAETLLPRTDTPGAADAGVPAFIDECCGRFMTPSERQTIESGLDAFDEACRATHPRGFAALPPAMATTWLANAGRDADGETRTFLRLFRDTAMLGYFTSEHVVKTALLYDPVPGRIEADIPLSEVGGKAWAE
ncbi:lactose 3-dehydrogenase subunit gamma LacC [Opitutales bacterium ASA1]|uniref:gluconate 2-dehydrogenase subunit 3 family protein n=1 Tax=Congregicoccus parvus TaxID=3081749 RepID=UPI002B29CC18|nr:lactose 3-dehydrogenase subunit gamma LacC [Opitutales bacterium ASA1]